MIYAPVQLRIGPSTAAVGRPRKRSPRVPPPLQALLRRQTASPPLEALKPCPACVWEEANTRSTISNDSGLVRAQAS